MLVQEMHQTRRAPPNTTASFQRAEMLRLGLPDRACARSGLLLSLLPEAGLRPPDPCFILRQHSLQQAEQDMSSKKEQQRRIREEKQAQAKRRERRSVLLMKVAALLLVPLALFVLFQGFSSSVTAPSPAQVAADDHVLGNPAAPVTRVVYGDFQCPACKEEAEVIARAWSEISNRVQLVFRHYPLDTHRHAFLAARYAEAAALQDRFWDMYNLLYAEQVLWSSTPNAVQVIEALAEQAGLDVERLRADAELPALREKILADQRGGTRAGVRATPSLFVNGRLVNNPRSAVELVALVARAERGQ
jgi:protein-disulfide isomerase